MYKVPFAEGDEGHLRRLPRHGLRVGVMLGIAIATIYGFGIGIITTTLNSEDWLDFIVIPISAALSGFMLGGLPTSLIGGSIGWLLGRKIKHHIHAARPAIQRWAVLTSLCILTLASIFYGLLVLINSPTHNHDIIIVYGFLIGIPGIFFTAASIWLGFYLQRWGQYPPPLKYREHVHDTLDEADIYNSSGHGEA